MITGEFVSCYSCAGEQSDRIVDQLGRGDVLDSLMVSKQSQSQNWKRKFIFFDHFSTTQQSNKTHSWVGVVVGRGYEGLGRGGGSG